MIATTTATPSAAPTWRATEFIPVAVAKLPSGAEATAVPARFGNVMPAPIPSSTMPGSHWPAKSGVLPTRSTNHSTAPPQAPGHEHGARAEALGQPAGWPRHRDRHQRADREGQARPQDRVPPHVREEQDIRQGVTVVPGRPYDHHRVGGADRPDPQQGQVEDREAVPHAAP